MIDFNYIHFEEIPSEQICVKFKEFFYKKDSNTWFPCEDNSYYRINIDNIDAMILKTDSDLVGLLGMTGKFFK